MVDKPFAQVRIRPGFVDIVGSICIGTLDRCKEFISLSLSRSINDTFFFKVRSKLIVVPGRPDIITCVYVCMVWGKP